MLERLVPVILFTPLAAAQTTIHVTTFPGGHFGFCEDSSVSGDGELVSFSATGTSVGGPAGTYLWRRSTGQHVLLGAGTSGPSDVARDGGHVAWTTAQNSLDTGDVFLYDVATGTSEQVNVDGAGLPLGGRNATPSVSADGRWVAYISNQASSAPGHPGATRHVVLRDMHSGVSELISVRPNGIAGNAACDFTQVSDDGNVVAFSSLASDLVPGDTSGSWEVFVRDRAAAETRVVTSVSVLERNFDLSADGRYLALRTFDQFVPEDQNITSDAYVLDRDTWEYSLASTYPDTGLGCGAFAMGISRHGRYVAFVTWAVLTPDDPDLTPDVYLRDRVLGTTEFLTPAYDGGVSHGQNYGSLGVSDDGRFSAFVTDAPRLVPGDNETFPDVFLRDRGEQLLGAPFCSPAVPNSTGRAAVATASGSATVAAAAFVLTATELPPDRTGYFLLSLDTGITQNPGGAQGDLCLAGTIGRFRSQVGNSGTGGVLVVPIDLYDLPVPLQSAVLPGETWAFQCWYRDANPGPTSNFTDAVVVDFQ